MRLPVARSINDDPERLPNPFCFGLPATGLSKIKAGKLAEVPDDPVRLRPGIGQDLVEDQLRIRQGLCGEPFEMIKSHA